MGFCSTVCTYIHVLLQQQLNSGFVSRRLDDRGFPDLTRREASTVMLKAAIVNEA